MIDHPKPPHDVHGPAPLPDQEPGPMSEAYRATARLTLRVGSTSSSGRSLGSSRPSSASRDGSRTGASPENRSLEVPQRAAEAGRRLRAAAWRPPPRARRNPPTDGFLRTVRAHARRTPARQRAGSRAGRASPATSGSPRRPAAAGAPSTTPSGRWRTQGS
jgi:hypothetical protein